MACTPCEKRREALRNKANQSKNSSKYSPVNISISFKGNANKDQIRAHGRIPIYCTVADKLCAVAVFNACDKTSCYIGTPKYDEILAEYDRKYQDGDIVEEVL